MNFKIFIVLLMLLQISVVFAQKKKNPPPPPYPQQYQEKVSIFRKDYKPISLEKRLAKYPFASATKIKIVSFNLYANDIVITPPNEPVPIIKNPTIELPSIINQTNLVGINQSKTLTIAQINKLTDILYNTCSKYNIESTVVHGCYHPRNAILFFDKEDKVFAYLEICFECSGNQARPEKITGFTEFCSYTYVELEKFFKHNGIETKGKSEN